LSFESRRSGKLLSMSRATLPPLAQKFALLMAVTAAATVAVMCAAPTAEAAKPCWERVIDDWVDNGRIDDVYSAGCITEARKHVPEDLRTYTDIIDKLDAYRQLAGRSVQQRPPTSPGGTEPGTTTTKPGTKEPEPNVDVERDEGPIPYVLGKGTTDASSIPLPLMVLAGLALALMAAGGVGVARRKLAARKIRR
jgi:hypothetical protein